MKVPPSIRDMSVNSPISKVSSFITQGASDWRSDRPDLGKFLIIVLELALIALLVRTYRVEEHSGLLRALPLILGGFVVHAWLPKKWRLPFFVGLSFVAIGLAIGMNHGLLLILLGLGVIGICHLPFSFAVRTGLLVTVGVVLAAVRAEWIVTPIGWLPVLILPLLGSMFMFRLIIYMYDLKHEKDPSSIWERLGYFFMLPNLYFLLFPVVDYRSYRRTYYDSESISIYQRGILRISRGIVHLLVYRFIYHYVLPSPVDVVGLSSMLQYMVATYALYLRISGQFHLIVGIMGLFGFNLPETHNLYFLASSFSDYWRRINIYWKDMMMKVFYYPSFMKLRAMGMTTGIVLSTLIVFVATWALHSYQWFWLRGVFPVTATDIIFWLILGGCVIVNLLLEMRGGKKKAVKKGGEWSLAAAASHSVKVVAMFSLLSVLWSLWSSESLPEFMSLVKMAGTSGALEYGVFVAALILLVGIGVAVQYFLHRGFKLAQVWSRPSFGQSVAMTSVGGILLLSLMSPTVHQTIDENAAKMVAVVASNQLNERDQQLLIRGYYEGLLNTERFTSTLWSIHGKPDDWEETREADEVQHVGGLVQYELKPSFNGIFRRAPFRTNQWGMRDLDYLLQKPAGTYRVAMLGSSYAMGGGVDNHQTFEAILEERLNGDRDRHAFARYEILNLSVGGYSVLHNVAVTRSKVFQFDPDAVFFILHDTEERRLETHIHNIVRGKSTPSDPYLTKILEASGLEEGMSRTEFDRRLRPIMEDVIRWAFEEIAEASYRNEAPPVALFVETLDQTPTSREDSARIARLAEEAGFIVLHADSTYGDHDPASLMLATWDTHPNIIGHQLIANRLYDVLLENDRLVGMGLRRGDVITAGDVDRTSHPIADQAAPSSRSTNEEH